VTLRRLSACLFAVAASPASAGPPYLTDDPAPTDAKHWEVYAFTSGEGRRSSFAGASGLDLNYGAVPGVQLTATLPVSFSHDPSRGWHAGSGDVEIAVKYRFLNDESSGISAAVFPRVILPTSSLSHDGKARTLLPIWLEKDFSGGTSVFGGGGYEVNPGRGNRNFWQAGIAVTHQLGEALSVGGEVARQGSDQVGGTAQTRAGVGAIVKLAEHYSLLVSGGPSWADHQTSYRFYAALGLNF
jgi:hypothetical protein